MNQQLPKVAVVQIGARHHYAIPRILEREGMLASFSTDSNAVRGIGSFLRLIGRRRAPGLIGKLVQRNLDGVPRSKVRSTDALLLRKLAALARVTGTPQGYVADDHLFDRIVAEWGFGGADTLYAMQKHGTLLLERARRDGLRVVVDVFITPVAHHIVEAERSWFPDIEPPEVSPEQTEAEDERTRREIAQADLLLCPGQNVVEGLSHFQISQNKAYAVVPYGSGVSFEGKRNEGLRGRVLFAGTADLRKGIHYLGMAAEKLRGMNLDIRVAGNVSEKVRAHPMMRGLRFLGRIPRSAMIDEFLRADVFVLPTLAEGCASVVHEAVMAGCPVITTGAAGTMVENGRGGLIIPERDPEALADAISMIVENRHHRHELAATCKDLAKELSEDAWGKRLLCALNEPDPKRFEIKAGTDQEAFLKEGDAQL